MEEVYKHIGAKLWQYITSILGGLLVAFETAIPFFIPCLIATALDICSAYFLARRVHKIYPDKSDGKFKSSYKYRVIFTMIIALIVIILANYVDVYVIKDSDLAVRSVVGFFLFYQVWSILENCSSENGQVWAKVLQRIMVNKAERHLNVEIGDLLNKEKENDNK